MEPIPQNHPLRRLFAGLVEQAFCSEVGVCNPQLTGYLADLLVEFTHMDTLGALRNAQGKRLDQMAAMLAVVSDDVPTDVHERDRVLYRRLGDYSLFWAGIYPEQLQITRRRSDVLIDYVTQGKRSYAIVSELAGENDTPPPSLFRDLSDDFESCLYGLGLVRRSWENYREFGGGETDVIC